MTRLDLRLLAALLAWVMVVPGVLRAQELRNHPTPFSVWLDFRALAAPHPPRVALPIWLDSLQSEVTEDAQGKAARTVFRLRFRPLGALNRELLVRVVFDDVKGQSPTLTGWSETGARLFEHGPFGSGLNLPTSASVSLPMTDVATIDITVPGDGSTVRGTFLSTLRRSEVRQPLDFSTPADTADAFNNLPSVPPPADDTLLMGRLRATIDPGVVKLLPREATAQVWEFELAATPVLATLCFEVLNADPLSPLDVYVNGQLIGAAAMRLPDLADPAYQGTLRPLDRGVRFRYAGWLQCQKAIPGSALRAGWNKLELRLPVESGAVAVRSLDLQLRSEWQNLDFNVTPITP